MKESYYNYMLRRLKEEKQKQNYVCVNLTSTEKELFERIEELERKVAILNHEQWELET
jgi:hypothetical protein